MQPLAARLRPRTLNEYFGQEHLIGPQKPLQLSIESGQLHSMIFWGPPGSGKTTLAKIIANTTKSKFISISAVLSGVKEIREAVKKPNDIFSNNQDCLSTILFVDEIHRFNKVQQDALLPYVESGDVTLIGATTENPSFEVINALLSRARVYVLKTLNDNALEKIIDVAITDRERGLGIKNITIEDDAKEYLILHANGDARRLLNNLEITVSWLEAQDLYPVITKEVLEKSIISSRKKFDKKGEAFYDQISALHKAVRGSCPDAALYWLARMLDGGCDPLYLARRIVRMAIEDIGNADPRCLQLALNAWDVVQRLGVPEGELALAQAVSFLSLAAKSNAVYVAFSEAMSDAKDLEDFEVPMHIRNAPTSLMKNLGYGKGYQYDHDERDAIAYTQSYFPDQMEHKEYYRPVNRGLEIKLGEKLEKIRTTRKENQ